MFFLISIFVLLFKLKLELCLKSFSNSLVIKEIFSFNADPTNSWFKILPQSNSKWFCNRIVKSLTILAIFAILKSLNNLNRNESLTILKSLRSLTVNIVKDSKPLNR